MTPMTPGRTWIWLRRLSQALVLVVVLVAPLLGGWQRLDRNLLASWDGHGWDLPAQMLEHLPRGEAPGRAYDALAAVGGGTAFTVAEVPFADPVAAVVALTAGATGTLLLALLLPILLALFAGRVWCGWMCPFGTMSRALEALLRRLPRRPPVLRLPSRRPLRWVLLVGALAVATFGLPALVYLLLPHALVQQSAYALWLMGGGGAALGWLLGLVVAGVAFGPTAYCAALCPTGAALSLPGHARRVRLRIADTSACGRHCNLCTQACWLALDPASGDPGPDCDACARCFVACPRTNLVIGLRRGELRDHAPSKPSLAAAALVLLGCAMGFSPTASSYDGHHGDDRRAPRLVLHATHTSGDRIVAVSAEDLSLFQLDADDPTVEGGTEITVYLLRGERGEADHLGRLAAGDVYRGPLSVVVDGRALPAPRTLTFERPTSPMSTPHRTLYRERIPERLTAGDHLVVRAVAGWLDEDHAFTVPDDNPGQSSERIWLPMLASFLLFGGLLSLAHVPSSTHVPSSKRKV